MSWRRSNSSIRSVAAVAGCFPSPRPRLSLLVMLLRWYRRLSMRCLPLSEAAALVSAGRALQTLRLGEWVMPVGELRSSRSVSTSGQAVSEADGVHFGVSRYNGTLGCWTVEVRIERAAVSAAVAGAAGFLASLRPLCALMGRKAPVLQEGDTAAMEAELKAAKARVVELETEKAEVEGQLHKFRKAAYLWKQKHDALRALKSEDAGT